MKSVVRWGFLMIIGLHAGACGTKDAREEDSHRDLEVQGVTVGNAAMAIHVEITSSERASCLTADAPERRVVLAVPGLGHTATTWRPLASSLLSVANLDSTVCTVVAIDMPGHGQSEFPTHVQFGDLTLSDYTSVVLGVLEQLATTELAPDAVIGHSLGGLIVMLAQQTLSERGTSLDGAFGIRSAVLLAPSMPQPLAWLLADSGAGTQMFTKLITQEEGRGALVRATDDMWISLFFSDLSGAVSPAAPSARIVADERYNAPEPMTLGVELVGAGVTPRKSVDSGLFRPDGGTELFTVAMGQDAYVLPPEAEALHRHLTGQPTDSVLDGGLLLAEDGAAVHDLHVSEPDRIASLLAPRLRKSTALIDRR